MPPRVGGLSPEGLWISPVALTGHSRAGARPMCVDHVSPSQREWGGAGGGGAHSGLIIASGRQAQRFCQTTFLPTSEGLRRGEWTGWCLLVSGQET